MIIHDYSYWRKEPRQQDFEMQIISRHPEWDGRKFAKRKLQGMNTIGVFDKESFEIVFTNHYSEPVNVRISLDGTDVLTGKQADLNPDHSMWYVKAGNTLHLKAWHESVEGGSRFVFTGADKSVALHTSGDMSHKGIIAVAVFTEGDRSYSWYYGDRELSDEITTVFNSSHSDKPIPCAAGITGPKSTMYGANNNPKIVPNGVSEEIAKSIRRNIVEEKTNSTINKISEISEDLKKEVAVGAGEYVSQKTRTVVGLRKPTLHSIIRTRYMWWDEFVDGLKKQAESEDTFPTGFPGEKIKRFADLRDVPKVESTAVEKNCVKDGVSRFE